MSQSILPYSFDLIVFIGRFQPFHWGHAFILETALKQAKKVVIILGSAEAPRSPKNPFTAEERRVMIHQFCQEQHPQDLNRIIFEPVEDRYYNESRWIREVEQAVLKHSTGQNNKIGIIGHEKDSSSYYLTSFPKFTWVSVQNHHEISATTIREPWFKHNLFQNSKLLGYMPNSIQNDLKKFQSHPEFLYLCEYAKAMRTHQDMWANTPYPVIFVTVDALVLCQEHVLLIQRGNHPGQGYLALPGGYLDPKEWIKTAVIRELIEETQIQVDSQTLTLALQSLTVFDHPDRSEEARKITHVGLIKLSQTRLPEVNPADDALQAIWVPLSKLVQMKNKIHGDHYPIMNELLHLD